MTNNEILLYIDSLTGVLRTFPKEPDGELLDTLEKVRENVSRFSLTDELKKLDIDTIEGLSELRDAMADTLFKIEQRLFYLGK